MHSAIFKRFTKNETQLLIFFDDYSSLLCESKFKAIHGQGLKILTLKQMLQKILTALAQARNKSENWLNEICQITYSLYRTKEITNKVYNNIMNLLKL